MVSFRTFVSALALAAPIAAQTAAQVVSNINTLTQQSTTLQPIAQELTILDTTLLLVGQGRFLQVIKGLQTQVSNVSTYVNQGQSEAPTTDATEATDVYNAYKIVSIWPGLAPTQVQWS